MLSWMVHWFLRLESFASSTDYNFKQVLELSSIITYVSIFIEISTSSSDSSSAYSPLSHQGSHWKSLQLTLNFSGIKASLLRLFILSSGHAFTAQTGRSMFRRFSKQAGWISFLEQRACGKNDAGSSIQNFIF